MAELALRAAWNDPVQAGQHFKNVLAPWCKSMWAAGHRLHVEVRLHEDAKTDRQRAYYHGVVLKTIAQQAKPNGQQYPLSVWKEHFRKEYLGHKTVTIKNPLTGKKSRTRQRVSTEDLGVKGYSQAAHLPPEAKGMKQSDLLTFPLCCTRVGIPGCHQDYDQYRLFPRAAAMAVGRAWAADTQRRILAMGLWPKALPLQNFSTGDDFERTLKNRT